MINGRREALVEARIGQAKHRNTESILILSQSIESETNPGMNIDAEPVCSPKWRGWRRCT